MAFPSASPPPPTSPKRTRQPSAPESPDETYSQLDIGMCQAPRAVPPTSTPRLPTPVKRSTIPTAPVESAPGPVAVAAAAKRKVSLRSSAVSSWSAVTCQNIDRIVSLLSRSLPVGKRCFVNCTCYSRFMRRGCFMRILDRKTIKWLLITHKNAFVGVEFTMSDKLQSLVFLLAACFVVCTGPEVAGVLATDANVEYFLVEIVHPVEGAALYTEPSFQSAGEFFHQFPGVFPIHMFHESGWPKIVAIVRITTPNALFPLVVAVTNLGLDMASSPLYSFEAFALFCGAPLPLAQPSLRLLPCARVYSLQIDIIPLGNATQYIKLLRNFTMEVLRLRSVGIIFDVYKFLGRVPASFLILGCGTPTFYDQLTLSLATVGIDMSSYTVGTAASLTKWNPMFTKGSTCVYGPRFISGKKKKKK
ncbi:uncharacterized protein LOC121369815 [Gigantopelta aegis]|uniref:uncharacterized protein LOC121369815 n=1 Tax=Gigantopelta aegis TaxID=1735272 RepID=UPI001B88B497|nr:uncharacterized protein LOC121369815 [Gigantopelta aegis]